jgi:amino acid transporter, AAT family
MRHAPVSYRMPGSPYTNWFVVAFLILVAAFLGLDADTRVALYVAPVWFAIPAIGYQITRAPQPRPSPELNNVREQAHVRHGGGYHRGARPNRRRCL